MSEETETDIILRKRLILVSALLHTQPPTDCVYANCARVLRHAMIAAGLWDERHEKGRGDAFQGMYEGFPAIRLWYLTLLEMAHQPEQERLLEGAGNINIPSEAAGAFFTACWLTPAGKIAAEKLLAEHPEWKMKLLQDVPLKTACGERSRTEH